MSSQENPSSRMREREMYFGSAPETIRSLTVPFMHRVPISPPGKKIGSTT